MDTVRHGHVLQVALVCFEVALNQSNLGGMKNTARANGILAGWIDHPTKETTTRFNRPRYGREAISIDYEAAWLGHPT